ncbi:hypothetical protein N7532_000320 [Penicillium argentinense]|uniref:K Homology domain-containing protein n=1 Tax=Penicillium argentinense TaxID=1131581 RepID=A0A9W9KN56_9EURO|nr:uncharacterized protein N7532_000320 [Penicillium argentinense]KAJ5112275.1 hypothetical protein N7532_000320 [Penicillium argentinense]
MADLNRPKRSRFDQTERPRRTQSDVRSRSRSPSAGQAEYTRTRSPHGRDSRQSPLALSTPPVSHDALIEATSRAAGIQDSSNAYSSPRAHDQKRGLAHDFFKDIDINDSRNRYTLTKGATQSMIRERTGADVTTRGSYYPDRKLATAENPPLSLRITSKTQEGLDQAVGLIEEMMSQELPSLVDQRRFQNRGPEDQGQYQRRNPRHAEEARIPTDLPYLQGFNTRAKIVGKEGCNVKHIERKTGCEVRVKGRGSNWRDHNNHESDEPMFVHILGPTSDQVKQASEMAQELLETVREAYEEHERNPPQRYQRNQGSGGGFHRSSGYDAYNTSGYGAQYSHNAGQYSSNSPGVDTGNTQGYNAQSAQTAEIDPYEQYGGYENYMRWVAYYQQLADQQAQQQADGAAAAPTSGTDSPAPATAPAPGTGSNEAPPPPPGL